MTERGGMKLGPRALGFVSEVPLPIREGLGEGRVARRFSPSPSLSPEGRGVLGQSPDVV